MMEFEYSAIDSQGSRHQGSIEAESDNQAKAMLAQKGLHPISLKPINNNTSLAGLFAQKVNLEQLEFFTSELSLLLESGVRVDKGIEIIQESNPQPALRRLLSQISSSLKKGSSLSEAFKPHEELFGPLFIQLLRIGETSGTLPQVLKRLADDMKFQKQLRGQIVSALTYPAVIFFVCMLAIYFVMTFIVPRMAGVFTDLEQAPWYTQIIVSASNFFVQYEFLIVGGILLLILGGIYGWQRKDFREAVYLKLAKLPGLGKVILTSERIRFSQSMSMMLEAGLQLDTTLELTADTLKHVELRRDAKQALKQVKGGRLLSVSLESTRIFPTFFLSIIKVGEESGRLPIVFKEVAERSRTELEQVIKRFTTVLEPLMLLFMGVFVGGIVISMLMSMVSLNDAAF